MGSLTARRRLVGVAIGTGAFVVVGLVAGLAIGAPVANAVYVCLIIGALVCAFEAFFVRSRAGDWFRATPPLIHVPIYGLVVVAVYGIAIVSLAELIVDEAEAERVYGRVGLSLPLVFAIAAFCILVVRVVSFLGARNLYCLLVGRYQRPRVETRIFAFIDLKDSTAITEKLGGPRARQFIAQFLFDLSRPITDHRGDIYKYVGDGLIATWRWDDGIAHGAVLLAVLEAAAAIEQRGAVYADRFGVRPQFRAGVHGGEVVVSEQGDLRRAIEFNGDAINIAARLEGTAKDLGIAVAVSGAIAEAVEAGPYRLTPQGTAAVRGISRPIDVFRLDRPVQT